jgi:hypothetical protein
VSRKRESDDVGHVAVGSSHEVGLAAVARNGDRLANSASSEAQGHQASGASDVGSCGRRVLHRERARTPCRGPLLAPRPNPLRRPAASSRATNSLLLVRSDGNDLLVGDGVRASRTRRRRPDRGHRPHERQRRRRSGAVSAGRARGELPPVGLLCNKADNIRPFFVISGFGLGRNHDPRRPLWDDPGLAGKCDQICIFGATKVHPRKGNVEPNGLKVQGSAAVQILPALVATFPGNSGFSHMNRRVLEPSLSRIGTVTVCLLVRNIGSKTS